MTVQASVPAGDRVENMSLADLGASAQSVASRMVGTQPPPREDEDERRAAAPAPAATPKPGAAPAADTPEGMLDLEPPEEKAGDDPLKIDLNAVPASYRPNFAAMRTKLEAAETELKSLREQVKAKFDKAGVVDATQEMQDLATQNDELRARLAQLDLASTPEFKTRFDVPMGAIQQQIKTAVQHYGGEEGLAAQLMALDIGARHALIAQKIPDGAAYLPSLFAQMDILVQQRAAALTSHAANMRTREAEAVRSATVEEQKQLDGLRVEAVKRAIAGKHHLLQKVSGTDERSVSWNTRVDALNAQIAQLFSPGADPAAQADALVKAPLADHYRALYMTAATRLKALEREFVARNGSLPRLGGAPRSPGARPGGDIRTAADAARAVASGVDLP